MTKSTKAVTRDGAFEEDIARESKHLQEYARAGFYPGYTAPLTNPDEAGIGDYRRVQAIVRKHLRRRDRAVRTEKG